MTDGPFSFLRLGDLPEPNEVIYAEGRLPRATGELEWVNKVVYTTPGGRKQLQLQVAREAGAVRKLRLQKVPLTGDLTKLETILELDRDQATRLIDMHRAIDVIPVEGEGSVHVDDQMLRDIFSDPTAIAQIYAQDPDRFRSLIETDANADDVIALYRRCARDAHPNCGEQTALLEASPVARD